MAGMTDASPMKYVAFDIDWKAGKFKVGACVPWAIAVVVIAVTAPKALLVAPVAIPKLLKWWRGG
jgi:hypothetical protein